MKRGFTLIELMVVIAIIGLLSSIVLASLSDSRARARDAQIISEVKETQKALELYRNDHENNYPTISDPPLTDIVNLKDALQTYLDLSIIPSGKIYYAPDKSCSYTITTETITDEHGNPKTIDNPKLTDDTASGYALVFKTEVTKLPFSTIMVSGYLTDYCVNP